MCSILTIIILIFYGHYFTSHLVLREVSLYIVSILLGHGDIKTTEFYAHLAPKILLGIHLIETMFIMKDMKRALRRHNIERLKNKRKNYWGWPSHDGFDPRNPIVEMPQEFQSFIVNTPKPCSCYACGNPRKYCKEKTFQEMIFIKEHVVRNKELLDIC